MTDSSGICSRIARKTEIPPTPESKIPMGKFERTFIERGISFTHPPLRQISGTAFWSALDPSTIPGAIAPPGQSDGRAVLWLQRDRRAHDQPHVMKARY